MNVLGRWPAGVVRGLVFGAAVAALVAGCRRTPTLVRDGGVRLVYEIDRERMAEITGEEDWSPRLEDLPELRTSILRRLSSFPGTTVEPLDEASLEITVPGVAQSEAEYLKELITAWGNLEFLILANERDHGELIDAALADMSATKVLQGGRVAGRWAPVGIEEKVPGKTPDYQGAGVGDVLRARRDDDAFERVVVPGELVEKIVREEINLLEALSQLGYRDLEVLVVVDRPGLNVSGQHLQRAEMTYDSALNPAVSFTMNDEGTRLMERLSSDNVPEGEFYRRLGILLDGELISAPRLMSTIGREGQITGNFTEEEVRNMVEVLRAGTLPALPKREPESEEWFSPP